MDHVGGQHGEADAWVEEPAPRRQGKTGCVSGRAQADNSLCADATSVVAAENTQKMTSLKERLRWTHSSARGRAAHFPQLLKKLGMDGSRPHVGNAPSKACSLATAQPTGVSLVRRAAGGRRTGAREALEEQE